MVRGDLKVNTHHDLVIKVVKVKGKQVTLRVEIIDRRDGPLMQLAEVTAEQDCTITLQGVGNCFNIVQQFL